MNEPKNKTRAEHVLYDARTRRIRCQQCGVRSKAGPVCAIPANASMAGLRSYGPALELALANGFEWKKFNERILLLCPQCKFDWP